MMRLLNLLIIISVAILPLTVSFGCREKHDIRLDRWEEEMAEAPDSVLGLLNAIDPGSLTTIAMPC